MAQMLFSADFSDAVLLKISKHIGHEWQSLATLLGLEKPLIEQIERKQSNDSQQINFSVLQVTRN